MIIVYDIRSEGGPVKAKWQKQSIIFFVQLAFPISGFPDLAMWKFGWFMEFYLHKIVIFLRFHAVCKIFLLLEHLRKRLLLHEEFTDFICRKIESPYDQRHMKTRFTTKNNWLFMKEIQSIPLCEKSITFLSFPLVKEWSCHLAIDDNFSPLLVIQNGIF